MSISRRKRAKHHDRPTSKTFALLLALSAASGKVAAQAPVEPEKPPVAAQPAQSAAPAAADGPFSGLEFRQVGPFRGGRVGAVTGVQSQPMTFYMGATGGGIWKTTDGGMHWLPIADGQIKLGSVGAIAVSDSDPNIVYAGMGEADLRGNASHGDGVYKSTDAGHTWKHMGLTDTQQIGAVKIDPKNPDIAYVAAMGHWTAPNAERGVFRTRDGGKTWQKVLFKSDRAGAIDLSIDPLNSEILYASIYQFLRKPWTFESGGSDSGLWKSTDGGDTWHEISRNPGLPREPSAASASPSLPPNPEASGPSSRPKTEASTTPTTPEPTGPRSTASATSSSAPGTTRASSPTPKTPTPCTPSTPASTARSTAAAPSRQSPPATATTMTSGSPTTTPTA